MRMRQLICNILVNDEFLIDSPTLVLGTLGNTYVGDLEEGSVG